jgi:hypothetical protein
MEEIIISRTGEGTWIYTGTGPGSGQSGATGGGLETRGDIVWAQAFDRANGVFIIKYHEGHETRWWALQEYGEPQPHPRGYRYYGIYYLNLKETGGVTTCKIFSTSDTRNQLGYGLYGPTEAATLNQAKERFTLEKREEWLDLDVGDAQTRQ